MKSVTTPRANRVLITTSISWMEPLYFRSDSTIIYLMQPKQLDTESKEYTQVEKAIFKVAGHLLARHSSVLRDMFRIPQAGDIQSGTDERPVILAGDSVKGWEIFLNLLYPEYGSKCI
jgi:hypothetical protein